MIFLELRCNVLTLDDFLSPPVKLAVCVGRYTHLRSEYPVEMALVRESCFVGDFAQPPFGRQDLLAGEFKSQTPDILADRAAHLLTKYAREMSRVNTGNLGDLLKTYGAGKIVVQEIRRSRQPRRRSSFLA